MYTVQKHKIIPAYIYALQDIQLYWSTVYVHCTKTQFIFCQLNRLLLIMKFERTGEGSLLECLFCLKKKEKNKFYLKAGSLHSRQWTLPLLRAVYIFGVGSGWVRNYVRGVNESCDRHPLVELIKQAHLPCQQCRIYAR